MESLRRALFEDPLYVYVFLGFVALAMGAMWQGNRSRRWLIAAAVPVVLAIGVFVVERMVETDREKIHAVLAEISEAVTAGDFDRVGQYLDDELGGDYRDKASAVRAGKQALEQFDIKSLRFLNPRLEIDGTSATLGVTTLVEFATQGQAGRTSLVWTIHWIRRDAGWRIHSVDKPTTGVDL